MAKLKARLTKESFDKLSESERSWYVPIDNGAAYIPDVEPVDGWGIENITGLVNTKEALRAEKADLERRLKAGGPSAELSAELAAVKGELEQLKALDPKGKADARVVEAENRWKVKLDQEQATWNKERSTFQREIDSRVRRADLAAALAAAKARSDRLDKLVTLHENRVRAVQREDGTFVTQVVNPDGTPAYSRRTGKLTQPMGLDEIAEEAMRELPEFFEGAKINGTGGGNAINGHGAGRFSISREVALNDPKQYDALKVQAKANGQSVTLTD